MGGAASTEAKPTTVNPNQILKTTKSPRTKKHEFKGQSSAAKFSIADRYVIPGMKEFDVDQLKLDVLGVLTGEQNPEIGAANNYPEGVLEQVKSNKWWLCSIVSNQQPQIALAKELASKSAGYGEIVEKLSSFLTARGSKDSLEIETLLLTGLGGSGVSTTIARSLLVAAQKLDDSNTTVVYRQIDSKTSTSWLLVSSICLQLHVNVPTCTDEMAIAIEEIMAYGTEDSPLVLIIDGLNHMTDDCTDAALEWLVPSLVRISNPFARVLLSTSPYPISPNELALCRSLLTCTILSLPSLSVADAKSMLITYHTAHKLPTLNEVTTAKISTALEAAQEEGCLSPCLIKLLVSGVLHPFLSQQFGHEILPDPIPATPQEAFEKLLIFLEQFFPSEAMGSQHQKHANPPLNTSPIKIERDARKLMTIQILATITLSRFEDGLTSNEIQQLIPPSPHSLPPSKPPLPSVTQILEELNRACPDLKSHLAPDSQGRWSWRHSVARQVAEYRYHALSKPSDTVGSNTPDEPTRILSSSYADHASTQRRLLNSKAQTKLNSCIKDHLRLLCVAQKKNELLSQLLDIKVLVAMCHAWGGVRGLTSRLTTYRRYALVERGIFLRRDKMDEFDAIILLFERYRRVIEFGIRERKLEVVFKQILLEKVLDCPAAAGVLEGFLQKLKKKEEPSRENLSTAPAGGRAKTAATSVTQRVSFSLDEKPWMFEPRRDYLVDAIGREPCVLVSPSAKVDHHVTQFVTSSDGRYIIAVIGGSQIRAFEAGPFREIWTVITEERVTALALSPTGKALAVAYADDIRIYKTSTGAKQASISSIPTEIHTPVVQNDADLIPESIEQPQPTVDVIVRHMVFSNDTTLLISTQIGHLYSWKTNHTWGSSQLFKCRETPLAKEPGRETSFFAMAKDEYTCAWWETIKSDDGTQKRDQDPMNTSTASKPQSTAKLSIFDTSLDTPSNALTHHVHLDLPALTAPIQFNSKGTQLIVVENDSLYCVDTKSGDLAWSITTSNAGLTGDWTNICLFKDFELNDALVGITADGWAVDVTDGYVRWRLYLGLREGDSIVSAAAMDGHLSIHKWSAARQFAIGHHIAYSTKRGGLFVIGLHQLGLGLKFALLGSKTSLDDDHGNGIRGEPPVPDLTPVINRIVGTSCDITTGQVLAVDATSVLHTSTAQQIRIATAGDAVLYGSIINSGITVVTTRNVFSFASYGNGSQLFKESALSNTPKTYTHPAKILNCVAVPVTVSSVFSTLLFLFDSTNTITTLSIPKTNGEGPPTVSSTMQIANNASDPIFILLPKVIDDTVSEITTITKQGRISNHSLDKKQQQPPQPPPPSSKSSKAAPSPAAPPPVTLSRIITENVFSESGCVLGVPGIKDPQVTCAGYSKNNQLLALGDSCGGIRILALGPAASETTGSEPSPTNPGDSSRSASTSEAKTNDNGNRSENGIIAGLRIHAAHFSSALVGLKWISDVEFVSVSADGVLAVWKTDRALKKVAVCGLLDGGNSTPTCLDVIEGSVDDHDDCCEFRVCVGGTDGRVNEYSLSMQ